MRRRPDLAARREELRHQIREAAIAEFAENGLRGTSTQAIADRAGITKTKLHYYIDSKEDLYQEALDHILGIWAELFHSIPDAESPEAFLRAYITAKLRFSLEHPEVAQMFSSEVMRGAPMLRAHWERSRVAASAASERIRRWVEKGLIRPVDPMLLQFNIWALTQHYALHGTEVRFMLGLEADTPLDGTAIADEIVRLVLNGLRPD